MNESKAALRIPMPSKEWGLLIPSQFYPILDQPAPLAGMAYPQSGVDWEGLYRAGYRHIICLAGERAAYLPEPVNLLLAVELEDLIHSRPPADPHREANLIRQAAVEALRVLEAGEGVIVHCEGGTGRTGTVLGCLLCEFGYPADEVLNFLSLLNKQRGRHGWPESPWQGDFVRSYTGRHSDDR